MPDKTLYKDITKYGPYSSIAGTLPYSSDRSVSQYKKIWNHPMCAMGIEFSVLGLADVPYIVESDNYEAAEVVKKLLSSIWKRLIRDSVECLPFGWKPLELRYEPGEVKYWDDDNPDTEIIYKGVVWKQPRSLDPEYIQILTTEDGSLRGFKQSWVSEDILVEDKKCLLFTNNLQSGNYYGISAFEPVYPYWYISGINLQFHTRWLERKGTGLFMGRYPVGNSTINGVSSDNSKIMLDLLDTIMEGTCVALPTGYDDKGNALWDIKLLEAADKTDSFIQFHEYLDKMILRGMVIPERALTQGEIGARASVEAFTDTFIQRKQDILDNIVDTISKYMVANLVEINWGPDVKVEVKSGKLDDNSKNVAEQIVTKLIESGREKVDRQWLIDKTGIPLEEPEEVEEPVEEVMDGEGEAEEDDQGIQTGPSQGKGEGGS